MSDEQVANNLTPVVPSPLIPRINGAGFYEEGDHILVRDVAGGVERVGTVGLTGSDGLGKDYMVVRYGDEPFLEAFIATARDVVEMLPDPQDEDELLAWLESGA